MKRSLSSVVIVLISVSSSAIAEDKSPNLLDERRGFKTKLVREQRHSDPLETPPEELFSIHRYPTKLGKMAAYVSKPMEKGRKYPAIVWITGGFPAGGIGSGAWEDVESDNDQSAKVYREAGLVMMYPALRGSHGNPGAQESFYGEVDDIIAAAKYLGTIDYVDSKQIYLGGHSTGGTLALLVAAATDQFRAVIAFGPAADPADYGADNLTYDTENEKECRLRAPEHFMNAIRSPTFVIEGTERSNIASLRRLERGCKNDNMHFAGVKGAGHFDVLHPVNRLIARKLSTLDANAKLKLSADEIQTAFEDFAIAQREADDLLTLAQLRHQGVSLTTPKRVRFYLLALERKDLEAAGKEAKERGFDPGNIEQKKSPKGRVYFELMVSKKLVLQDLGRLFETTATLEEIEEKHDLQSGGWDVE